MDRKNLKDSKQEFVFEESLREAMKKEETRKDLTKKTVYKKKTKEKKVVYEDSEKNIRKRVREYKRRRTQQKKGYLTLPQIAERLEVERSAEAIEKAIRRCYRWLEIDDFIKNVRKICAGKIYCLADRPYLLELMAGTEYAIIHSSWIERLYYWQLVAEFLGKLGNRFEIEEIKVWNVQIDVWNRLELGRGLFDSKLRKKMKDYKTAVETIKSDLQKAQDDVKAILGNKEKLGETEFRCFCEATYDYLSGSLDEMNQNLVVQSTILEESLQVIANIQGLITEEKLKKIKEEVLKPISLTQEEKNVVALDEFCETTNMTLSVKMKVIQLEKHFENAVKQYNPQWSKMEQTRNQEKLFSTPTGAENGRPAKPLSDVEEVLLKLEHIKWYASKLTPEEARKEAELYDQINEYETIVRNSIIDEYKKSCQESISVPDRWKPKSAIYKRRSAELLKQRS